MIKTPNNLHLFLRIGEYLPLSYFNPPKDCDYVVAFRISDYDFDHKIEECDKYHYVRKMGGWVLDDIRKSHYC